MKTESRHSPRTNSLLASPGPVRWVFTGDSITHGARHTFGHRDYTEHFSERVRYELGRVSDCVIKTAINGARIKRLADELENSVLQYRPHFVFFNYGMNDCIAGPDGLEQFVSTYRAVLKEISEETGAALILHTPVAVLPADTRRFEFLPAYVEAIRALAKEMDALLVDNHAHWEQARERKVINYWLSDAIHPNEYGHRAMAHHLLKCLDLFDEKSAVCRLFVP